MLQRHSRNVFLVVAGGNPAAERHFEDTIQRKRTITEVRQFLPSREIENLEKIYHSSSFIVWGAAPGPMNETRWAKMTPGDVVLIYNLPVGPVGQLFMNFSQLLAFERRDSSAAWNARLGGKLGHDILRSQMDASFESYASKN